MSETVLKALPRTVIGKQVKALRRAGRLPAVIYGKTYEPVTITLDMHESTLILPTLTSSHLVTVDVEGALHTTLVREKQRHAVTGCALRSRSNYPVIHRRSRTSMAWLCPISKIWKSKRCRATCRSGS
jgi:ribosomal protein L25 (general stress protein Ctc)